MDAGVLSALVVGAVSIVVTFITTRQNRQGQRATTALSERVVNREDFDAVMDRTEKALERALLRVDKLEEKLELEVSARQEADRRATSAEERAEAAEQRVAKLERRVQQLERVLEAEHIPVPPPLPDP